MPTPPDKPALPAITWAALLLVPLLLSAGHVPLWARANATIIESYSLRFMLAVQFAMSAMLFPWLMRDPRSALFTILLSTLFIQLAAMLGGERWETAAVAIIESCLWLTSLALWKAAIIHPKHLSIAVAVASTIILGGGTIQYLQLEFGSGTTPFIAVTTIWIGLCVNLIGAIALFVVAHRQLK